MKKRILLAAGILALSSMAFGAATDPSGHADTGNFTVSANVITNLTVAVTGDLAFGDVVVPDTGTNTRTITADATGITVAFSTADKDETVQIELSGTGVDGTTYSPEAGLVFVNFVTSTGTWAAIPTSAPIYIGGTVSVLAGATSGDTDVSSNVTVTVTYDSIV